MEMARYCINRAKAEAEDGNDVDRTPADVEALAARARHSAHAAALPDHPEAALVAVLRHEADLRQQT